MSEIKNDVKLNAQPLSPVKAMDAKGGKDAPPRVREEAELGQPREAKDLNKSEFKSLKDVEAKATNQEELQQAVAKLNDYTQKMQRELNFQMDEESGLTVVKVFNSSTDELIRQIPSEELVQLAQKLNKEEPLFLFSARV